MKFFIRLFLSIMITISAYSCTAENEDGDEIENKPQEPAERHVISPKKEYTKENPAEWKRVARDHIPEIEFDKSKSKENVKVKVQGRNFSERHYIEVIGIMDERSRDIDIKYIERGSEPIAILTLNLKEYNPEKIKVFAKCNLHDLWTEPLVPLIE